MVRRIRAVAVKTRSGRRLHARNPGQAVVELVLVMPVLLLLVFGIIEFARAWNVKQVLTDAAREGARIAVVTERQNLTNQQHVDSITRVVRRAAWRASLDTTSLTVAPTTSTTWQDSGTEANVLLTYIYRPLMGRFVLKQGNLTLRSSVTMRLE